MKPAEFLAYNPQFTNPNKVEIGQKFLTQPKAEMFSDNSKIDFAGGAQRFQAAKGEWNANHPKKPAAPAAPAPAAGTPPASGASGGPPAWMPTQGGKQVFTPTETQTAPAAPTAPAQRPDFVQKQFDYADAHGGNSLNGPLDKITSGGVDYKYPGFNKKSEAADIIRKIAAASNFASSVKDPMTSGGDSGKALPTADMSNTGNAYGSQAQRGTFGNAAPAETTIPGMPTDKAPKDTSKIDVGQFKPNQATTTR
jgi:hypothetical protein